MLSASGTGNCCSCSTAWTRTNGVGLWPLESKRLGHGGDRLLSQITGMDEKTIRRGREELDASLADNPPDRIRRPGGGRPPVEKKTPG